MTYGSEAWTLNNKTIQKIEATEMWFLRAMQRIPYTARVTNIEVLDRAGTRRNLANNIRQLQAKFIGHIIRRDSIEHLITTGKIDGRRSRGRQREKITDALSKWLQTTPLQLLVVARDREVFRAMVANATRHGT